MKFFLKMQDNLLFQESVVRDERSFQVKNIQKFMARISNQKILEAETSFKFNRFLEQLKKLQNEILIKETLIHENVPEEFLDPILCEIMQDPVKLPQSGVILDKKTIKQHLIDDPTDPFNRTPLDISQVIEMKELKHLI